MLKFWLTVLLLCNVASAMAVVTVRHQHRSGFVSLRQAQLERDALNTQWNQLLLEIATFSFHHRVENQARKRLKMSQPRSVRWIPSVGVKQ